MIDGQCQCQRASVDNGCYRLKPYLFFNPYIDGFTRLAVLEDTPHRLVVYARYFYRDRFQQGGAGAGGQICAGFGERTFTLARGPDGGPVGIEMTGEQYEPAIRSLIRRVLPD